MGSVADPQQIEDSILFPEIIEPSRGREEAQMDNSSQCTLMSKELLEAALNGHEKTLTELLGLVVGESPDSAHVTIEAPDNDLNQAKNLKSTTCIGNTILHILAGNGHAELALQTYMKDRSLLEVCNNRDETAVHCAARFGHDTVISKLIVKARELKYDLKDTLGKKNMHKETALHEAARYGHTATVKALIEEDLALAGMVNKSIESPLYLATVKGRVDVVRLLVQHLCDKEITSEYYSGPKRSTALHAAALRRGKCTDMHYKLMVINYVIFSRNNCN
ncbi:Ankyrin repeat-containing protein [Rhynchospora pubera]|uniref:Ankyrin repeat-containing protein n=1 Tax=Rhynchospora pubera TaxID=906938 RepID=A0AAV8ATB1_9POAL|nr:Ankyrin repeat-containing protein [Rhynchospora pubera]KAJ4760428.1 Ankyrin repeat-containing protein [Rhynchospora pubera]